MYFYALAYRYLKLIGSYFFCDDKAGLLSQSCHFYGIPLFRLFEKVKQFAKINVTQRWRAMEGYNWQVRRKICEGALYSLFNSSHVSPRDCFYMVR